MERNFQYFRDQYGDAGARDKFQQVCLTLFRKMFGSEAATVRPNPGDEGIDIFVGNFSDPIEVYQCKYFLDGINATQKDQIRKSYKTSFESEEYTLKKWILCLPCVFDIPETKWWDGWRKRTIQKNGISIELIDGAMLLDLLKEYNLYNQVFEVKELQMLEEIHENLIRQKKVVYEVVYDPIDEDFNSATFIAKLESAKIMENDICKKEFYNAEILKETILTKGLPGEIEAYKALKESIHGLWFTQYIKYNDENDGHALLSRVYERIEDCIIPSSLEITSVAKKGIIHQIADSCEAGWVKNYKNRFRDFIVKKGSHDDQ